MKILEEKGSVMDVDVAPAKKIWKEKIKRRIENERRRERRRMKKIDRLARGEDKTVRIEGHIYRSSVYTWRTDSGEHECVHLEPAHGNGDTASSVVQYNDYMYTHGGRIYQKAVEMAHEIYERMVELRATKK